MSVSLHAATVGTFLQILPSVSGLVDKAEEHCRANGLEAEALTGARLAEDQWTFAKQVFECGHHSSRAIEGVRAGVFEPELHEVPLDFASLRKELADAIVLLQGVEPAEIDGMVGRDMRFAFGGKVRMEFAVEDFLLSFSVPNFFFHATTAYDILRHKGVPLGKRDFLGRMRIKR